ncbi:MAG: hypothetical protein DIZ80_07745 [endosymbiont of Galathealinum brachiosum]|uniref:Uncharacterized protein n=1 Tax=endosymbiont of Galathealinum brachiosum TaxID=2200906 RepID=A0A370DGH6_9GAMM|nr:MAG: hypothetical protein DIZ80_07745 [endosymbiont of Galathealinum brachiosum]
MAVGVINNHQRSKLGRLWWQVASVPYKLSLSLSLFHVVVMAVLYHSVVLTVRDEMVVFIMSVAIIAPFILSLLINFLPDWYHSTKIDYDQYGAASYLMFISVSLMELGLVLNELFFVFGGLLLVISWLLEIKMILRSYMWSARVSFSLASRYNYIFMFLLVVISTNIFLLYTAEEITWIINIISVFILISLLTAATYLFSGRQSAFKPVMKQV